MRRLLLRRLRPGRADYYRGGFLTAEQHQEEARRILWVIDGELQSGAPRTIRDLSVIALAHAVTALAADRFENGGRS